MRQVPDNSNSAAAKLFNQLAAEKKKTVMAICLIALMVFMWLRVLGKKTPKTTSAAVTAQPGQKNVAQTDSQLNISFVELPIIKGRNDGLTRDFFASNNWQGFLNEGGYENLSSSREVNEVVKLAAGSLKLQAIELGKNPRAFIDGKLLSVGDKLFVADGGGSNKYEFEVIKIEQNMVFMKSGQIEVKLKLTESIEVLEK